MSAYIWFGAGVLAGIAASAGGSALLRSWPYAGASAARRSIVIGVTVGAFLLTASGIYFAVDASRKLNDHTAAPHAGMPGAQPAGAPQSMEVATAGLAARLARDGGTADEWNLLAQSYEFLGRTEEAKQARARASTSANPGAAPAAVAPAAAAPAAGPAPAATVAAGPSPAADLTPAGTAMIVRQLDLGQGAAPPASAPAQRSAPTIAELEQTLRVRPRDVDALLDLAELHRRDRAYAKARADYAKVIALNGMNAATWADYADVLGSLSGGRLNADATRAVDRSLALDPANSKALWLKATAAYQDHRYADALAVWKTLRATLPADSSDVKIVDANIAEASQLAGATQPAGPAATPKGG